MANAPYYFRFSFNKDHGEFNKKTENIEDICFKRDKYKV